MKKFLQKELYEGIRLNKAARLQPILFLVRRAALCLIITLCRSIDRFIFMGIYSFINLVHCLLICCIRPFKNTSENITDVMNEVFLVFFSIFLAFHRLESDWDSTKTAAFYWILVMNNMLNALLSIGKLFTKVKAFSYTPSVLTKRIQRRGSRTEC
ncbi:unnamed protein product [Moneuplotes crassus]|uniref:Uncharacterized protein n=1 Tax=Euplotes crassus TaxID=5936 RepID=A0AAD1UUI8_EUPCR|nr:unnamed protein product [Moneuplotes crassus]